MGRKGRSIEDDVLGHPLVGRFNFEGHVGIRLTSREKPTVSTVVLVLDGLVRFSWPFWQVEVDTSRRVEVALYQTGEGNMEMK